MGLTTSNLVDTKELLFGYVNIDISKHNLAINALFQNEHTYMQKKYRNTGI